jgi:glycosyltransferase involved in cell wall biosynthesis
VLGTTSLATSTDPTPEPERDDLPAPVTHRFTVLTPTRDRAHVLHRVHDSLRDQTFRDFEWLIVDNGSSDGTADLVAGWQTKATFPIRYIVQDNAGVHASWNRGVAEAHGELLLEIRSADTFPPEALERFDALWREIPTTERDLYSGVTVNCVDEHGRLIGTEFPQDVMDSDSSEIRFRYKVKGEKWGFQRMDIMREFPMPVVDGYTAYVPEAIVWRAIGRDYRTRYVNERLRVYWQDQTNGVSVSPFESRAVGGLLESEALLNEDLRWFRYDPIAFVRKAAKYSRSSFHVGRPIRAQAAALRHPGARLLWAITLPAGWLCYRMDRRRTTPVERDARPIPRA